MGLCIGRIIVGFLILLLRVGLAAGRAGFEVEMIVSLVSR